MPGRTPTIWRPRAPFAQPSGWAEQRPAKRPACWHNVGKCAGKGVQVIYVALVYTANRRTFSLTRVQHAPFDIGHSGVAAHVATLRLSLGICVVAVQRAIQQRMICACRPLRVAFVVDGLVEEGSSVPRRRAETGLESLLAQCLVDNEGARLDVNIARCETSRLAVGHPIAIMQTFGGMFAVNAPVTARSASNRLPPGIICL